MDQIAQLSEQIQILDKEIEKMADERLPETQLLYMSCRHIYRRYFRAYSW